MRILLQRVSRASVTVRDELVSGIGSGLLLLVGVGKEDGFGEYDRLAERIVNLRIFEDEQGKMNRSLADIGGSVLVVSQFTLLGRTANGRRPSFDEAAPSDEAKRLYEQVVAGLRNHGTSVETGVFAAHMQIELLNDGPVTFVIDSRGAN